MPQRAQNMGVNLFFFFLLPSVPQVIDKTNSYEGFVVTSGAVKRGIRNGETVLIHGGKKI